MEGADTPDRALFSLPHGVPRVDDRRIVGGINFVIGSGLRWREAPTEHRPPKTIYNRFIRWSRLGLFNNIFAAWLPRREARSTDDRSDLSEWSIERRPACSKKEMHPDISDAPKAE